MRALAVQNSRRVGRRAWAVPIPARETENNRTSCSENGFSWIRSVWRCSPAVRRRCLPLSRRRREARAPSRRRAAALVAGHRGRFLQAGDLSSLRGKTWAAWVNAGRPESRCRSSVGLQAQPRPSSSSIRLSLSAGISGTMVRGQGGSSNVAFSPPRGHGVGRSRLRRLLPRQRPWALAIALLHHPRWGPRGGPAHPRRRPLSFVGVQRPR